MAEFEGPNALQVQEFVRQAVRLGQDALKAIRDRVLGGDLYVHTAVVKELASASRDAKQASASLRQYVELEARLAAGASGPQNPEWIADAVFPSAQAIMLGPLLEGHTEDRRRAAYDALIGPFRTIVK